MREENSTQLFQLYYDSLTRTLEEEKLDVKKIFPWNELLNSIEALKFPCMTLSLAYMSIDILESNSDKEGAVTHEEVWNHLSVDTSDLVCNQFEKIPYYKERIYDSLLEIYEHFSD